MQTITTDGSSKRPAGEPAPRPSRVRGLPFFGSTLALVRDPLGFLERISREHGDVVELRVLGDRVLLLNHPDAIDDLLIAGRDHLTKDRDTRRLKLFLGNGLLVSEGTFWRKQRKLAQPAFHRQRIDAYADAMVSLTERAVAKWSHGEERDSHRDMMALTLEIVSQTLFGAEVEAATRRIAWSVDVLLERFGGIGRLIPMAVPTPTNLRVKKAIAQLDEIVYGLIRDRRKAEDKGDLLSMLLAATSEEAGSMTDEQVRDEAVTLLLAGHETTAIALSFAFHLLGTHPEVAARLHREIEAVLGARPATAADLSRLPYAEGVIRESMRLYPPAWAIGREAIAPCTIAGHAVEPGTQLWASQWVMHRDPRWFPNPNEFRPERWENQLAKTLPKHAYFPFGGGPRVCIGNVFAMMEAVLVLVTIARRVDLELTRTKPVEIVPSITIRPKGGLPTRVRKR